MSEAMGDPRRHRPGLIPVMVVVLAGMGIGIGVAVAMNDDDGVPGTSSAARLANVQQACEDWMGSTDSGDRPSGDWCAAMTGWMSQQMVDGRMTGQMMWGDPDRMLSTCGRWATANGTASDQQWCDDMVAWMREHMADDRGNWMMNGSMMGR